MYQSNNTELSSPEETRLEFNPGKAAIKLGIDVHQEFYVVAMQVGGTQPKPAQRFRKEAFLRWAAKLARTHRGPLHAVYEACGFGFGLQRQLSVLGIECYVVCPQKLDEHNKRVKTDSLDAKALCLKLDHFTQGNRDALALVRVPREEEEQLRAVHRQREQLVKARKQLEAQGRSLMVNHGVEPVKSWWKRQSFAALSVPEWMERTARPQSADPACLGGEDPCPHRPAPGSGRAQPTARPGSHDQCDHRSGNWQLEPLPQSQAGGQLHSPPGQPAKKNRSW